MEKYPDERLTVAAFDLLCPWLPARWRDSLRCGMPHEDNNMVFDCKEVPENVKTDLERRNGVLNLSYVGSSAVDITENIKANNGDLHQY